MKNSKTLVSRRQLLKIGAAGAIGSMANPRLLPAQGCLAQAGTVRDRLWLFTVAANADLPSVGRRSLMTPAEGAYYLAVPNIIMVQTHPTSNFRFEPPIAQYDIALRPFKRVLWSVVGAGGFTTPEYRDEIFGIVEKSHNIAGIYMDDFFFSEAHAKKEGRPAALTLDELRQVKHRVKNIGEKLEIAVTFYTSLLDRPVVDYLELIDVITMWTSRHEDLVNLEANLTRLDKLVPGKRKMLGCYFFDFNSKEPVRVDAMRFQCETGLRLLREGRIEGMVFLANTQCDLGYESVEWTRAWISKVADSPV